jgi:hypothetical protein
VGADRFVTSALLVNPGLVVTSALLVTPAQAGAQGTRAAREMRKPWVPAFAGMTKGGAGMTKGGAGMTEWRAGMTQSPAGWTQ